MFFVGNTHVPEGCMPLRFLENDPARVWGELCDPRVWVGAPNERAPFRFHDGSVDFADRCLTRTRIADRRPGFGRGFMNIARAFAPATKLAA